MPRRPPAAALWMIGGSLSFTAMAACTKLAGNHGVPIGQIVFFRGLVALVGIASYMALTGVPFATPHLGAHVRRGTIGFIGIATYLGAITMLPMSTAVTINYTSPLWLALMLVAIHRERPRMSVLFAALAGLGGVALLLRPTFNASQWTGAIIAIASAFTGAITALNIRALGKLDEPPLRTVFYFSAFIVALSLPWWLASDPLTMDLEGALYLLGLGLFAMFGQWLITHAYRSSETLLVSMLGYSQVVFTALLGVVLWNDHLGWEAWIGMALIVGSGAFASTRRR